MTETSSFDSFHVFRKTLVNALIGFSVLTVVSAVIGVCAFKWPGLWSALLGSALGGGFLLTTAVVAWVTRNSAGTTLLAAIMGSWIVKVAVVIIALASLKGLHFYHKGYLGAVLLASVLLVSGAEIWALLRTRALYVDPK